MREWGQEEGVSWEAAGEAAGEHWKREREREREKINEMLIKFNITRLTLQYMEEEGEELELMVCSEVTFHLNALSFH